MIDAKRLNNTIQDLEGQVINIKKITSLINRIEELSTDLTLNTESNRKTTDEIKVIESDIVALIENYTNYMEGYENNLENLRNELSNQVELMDKRNIDYHGKLSNSTSDIIFSLDDTKTILRSRMLDLASRLESVDVSLSSKLDNNDKLLKEYLYLELQENVNSIGETVLESEDVIMDRFDKSILDLKVELANYINENIASSKTEIMQKLDENKKDSDKKLNIQISLLIVIIGILIVNFLIK